MNECNLYCKIVKYSILSEVCMMKTVPHSTVSPQMWCINGVGLPTPRFVCKTLLCKVNLSNPKNSAWFCFPGLINLRNVIEIDFCFLGVHMSLSTWCKILFTLGLFANYFSLKSLSLFVKSQMNVLCALKLTELWNTNLFLDLNIY